MENKFEGKSIVFYVHGHAIVPQPEYGHLIFCSTDGRTSELTVVPDDGTGKVHVVVRPK